MEEAPAKANKELYGPGLNDSPSGLKHALQAITLDSSPLLWGVIKDLGAGFLFHHFCGSRTEIRNK